MYLASRKLFVMAFPSARRESFVYAHLQAVAYFGGIPRRITDDTVPTAVQVTYEQAEGKSVVGREETKAFQAFGR
jgi:transposase